MLRPLPLLPAVLLAASGVLLATPASAQTPTSIGEIVQGLQGDQVYIAPDFSVRGVDEGDLSAELDGSDVDLYVVAVTTEQAPSQDRAAELVQEVGRSIGDSDAAVIVINDEGNYYTAEGQAAEGRGVDAAAAAENSMPGGQLDADSLTAFVGTMSDTLDRQLAGDGAGGTGGDGSAAVLLPLLLVGGLGFGAYALTRSRKRAKAGQQTLQDLRADVESLYGRLGSDVETLAPGDDAIARQALSDASERYNATGALMSKADSPGEFAAARRTAVEGLAMARVVRQRLGLDPGPEVPLAPSEAPQLEAPSRVQVGEDEYDGSPQYEPGRPHYYEGGYYGDQRVPGGWYATPFWQTLLLTSVLNSGRGGYGRGYGGGYGGGMGGGMSGGFGGGVIGGGGGGGAFGGRTRRASRRSGGIGFGSGGGRKKGGGW